MLGAGIFAAFAPAARVAGAGLLVGLAIAAVIAVCNATASAQLAAQYPTSGGTYVYGRERLGEWPGFLAGWTFVIGKTASCAAMALTFAAYVAPGELEKPVAVAAMLVLAGINSLGVTRTAGLARIIVTFVLAVLILVVVLGISAASHLSGAPAGVLGTSLWSGGWYATLQSAGILFFAFAGYARIATMGEEVRRPERTIPRAILIALGVALGVYAVVAVTGLLVLGPDGLAAATAPLSAVATAGGATWAAPVVSAGAAAASLGALLALIAGVGRTSLAMARNGDLPKPLAAVHPKFRVPYRAELTLALVASVLIVFIDLRGAIGISSFGVLLYYFIANVAAFTQDRAHRRYPKALQALGALGCLVLVVTLPPEAIGAGFIVIVLGVAARLFAQAFRRRRAAATHLE